jgi:hypothetical protein
LCAEEGRLVRWELGRRWFVKCAEAESRDGPESRSGDESQENDRRWREETDMRSLVRGVDLIRAWLSRRNALSLKSIFKTISMLSDSWLHRF